MRFGILMAGGLLFVTPAMAQDRVPLPEASPMEPADPAPPVSPPDPSEVPLPEARPDAPQEAPAEPSGETAATPPPAAASNSDEAPSTPPADQPQPAYVPPEKARTVPEPGAPETPPMEVTPAETVEAAAAVEDAMLCEAELKKRGVEFTVGETIAEGDCGVLRPVSLKRMSSGATVDGGTTFLCRTALALDIWVADGVAPAAKAEFDGASVETLSNASTYACRARSSEARISEHSRGSAIDIASFELSNGKTVPVEAAAPGTPEDRFAAALRRAACGPFRTVLGPGTDSDHGRHLHLDIAARTNGSTYCR